MSICEKGHRSSVKRPNARRRTKSGAGAEGASFAVLEAENAARESHDAHPHEATPSPTFSGNITSVCDLPYYTPPEILMLRSAPTPTAVMASCVGYARYSSNIQKETSIERQRDRILAYAQTNGLSVAEIFTDIAISGTVSARPGLDAMLAFCARHPGTIVIVENVDRLLRSMDEYARIYLAMARHGTVLHDMSGRNSELVEVIKAGVASEDRTRLLDRVALGKIASAKAGRWISNRIPYGYRVAGPARIEVDEAAAENVRTIFALRLTGLNYRQLGDELHKRGIMPPECSRWTQASLRKILRNQVYVGWCVWRLTRPAGHA